MKRTLLDIVQGILNETGGDEVNSISDTIEATGVAKIVQQVYTDLVVGNELPSTGKLIALEGLGDVTKPSFMRIPEKVQQIQWIKYDCRTSISNDPVYPKITYLEPDAFTDLSLVKSPSDTTENLVVNYDANVTLIIGINRPPSYWTSFDDQIIVFDSLDQTIDATMQSSKSICYARVEPTFTIEDTFIPDLPGNLFNVLYTKSLARVLAGPQHQTVNPEVQREVSRSTVRTQRNKWRQSRMNYSGPDFSRRPYK